MRYACRKQVRERRTLNPCLDYSYDSLAFAPPAGARIETGQSACRRWVHRFRPARGGAD